MKCKVCGTMNEDYLEYCENCAAPLEESVEEVVKEEVQTSAPREERAWGFVASPVWAKPDFSANNVSEDDIPKDFRAKYSYSRFTTPSAGSIARAREALAQAQAAQAPCCSVQRTAAAGSKRNSVRTYAKPAPAAVCPHCGASVAAGQRFCNACGQPMDASPAPAAAPVPVQAAPIAAAAAPVLSAAPQAGIKYADPIDDDMFAFDYDSEDEEEDTAPRRKNGKKEDLGSAYGNHRSRKRSGLALDSGIFFWIIAAVLVVALVVMGVIVANKTYGGVGAFFSTVFSSSPVTQEPTVEKSTTENGDPAYNITIHAKRNSIIRFEGGSIKNETPVTNNAQPIILSVPEAVWVPGEPVEGDKLEIYPNITIISKDGTETPVTFSEPIVIDIPTLNLSVTAPGNASFDTATPDITFSGAVDDPTSTVFINDMQVALNEAGMFEAVYTLGADGTNTVDVEARKNGYAIARQTFIINYTSNAAGTVSGPAGGSTGSTPGSMPTGATAVGYVTTADLKVRSEANSDNNDNVLGTLPLNQKVYIIEMDTGNAWAKILYNGNEAYASNLYIKAVDDYATKDATVTTDKLKGRASGSSSGDIVVEFPLDTKVSFIKDVGSGWSMIEYQDKILFAATNYLSVS